MYIPVQVLIAGTIRRAQHALALTLIFSAYALGQAPSGLIATIAGNGVGGLGGGDGAPPLSANFQVSSIAIDSAGNTYILDPANGVVREVSGGIITTIAGS